MNFKRMQSRVFWGQMAAHDRENIPLLVPSFEQSSSRLHQSSYCNFGRDSDTDAEKNSDKSLENEHVTVIEVGTCADANDKEICDEEVDTKDTVDAAVSANKDQNEDIQRPKTVQRPFQDFSFLDEGHGSLDSGFSDSDRSTSPYPSNDSRNKRRRMRKRLRNKTRKVLPNLKTRMLWLENDIPNPSHTSTPKRTSLRVEEKHAEAAVEVTEARPPSPCKDETLGDFLYASEPPEDDVFTATSTSTSRGSTPSFSGPCYTRILTESSSKSTSRSLIERSQRIIQEERSQEPVKAWLKDLAWDSEPECVITLQNKALARCKRLKYTVEEEQTRNLKLTTASCTSAASELLVRANGFAKNIQEVIRKISHLESGKSERDLLRGIEDEAFSILSELEAPPPRRIHDGSLKFILQQLRNLQRLVDGYLDKRLDEYIERVVQSLEEAPRESGSVARGALAALTALGVAGTRAGNSIARCSGVHALLTLLVSATRLTSELRASTLRALSCVCSGPLPINNFVQEGGPEILVDLLISKTTPEREKMEATALVVQITAPWTDALGLRHLEAFSRTLVATFTDLAVETKCRQTLLLTAAALNNFADSDRCARVIVECDTVRQLLRCVKKAQGGNIWLMEQLASLINKLAKREEFREYLAKIRASVALVYFVRMAPPGMEETYQRLSATAASALTRLCVEPEIARQVVAVGGENCLPDYGRGETSDEDEQEGILRYTKSLRLACRKAATRIYEAKASDYSIQ